MDNISSAATQYIRAGRELVRLGNFFTALDNYISAQNEIPEFYVKRSLYTALSGGNYEVAGTISPAGILAEIRALFSGIHIKIISGDNQNERIGTVLSVPVVAKIFYLDETGRECGLRQFPIIVKYTNGEIIGKPKTDDAGSVAVKVIASPGGPVIFTPDFRNVPVLLRNDLTKIQALVTYTVLASNIAVSIEVQNLNGQPDLKLYQKVSRLVNENGYKTDSSAPLIIQGQTSMSNEKIISSPAGKQYFIELELCLSLIDKVTGVQLASIAGSGKGLAVGSLERAYLKAAEKIKFSKSKFAAFLRAANQP